MQVVPLLDYAGFKPAEHAALATKVRDHTTLARVMASLGAGSVEEIITQDEFTHDVLIPVNGGRYLAYDST